MTTLVHLLRFIFEEAYHQAGIELIDYGEQLCGHVKTTFPDIYELEP